MTTRYPRARIGCAAATAGALALLTAATMSEASAVAGPRSRGPAATAPASIVLPTGERIHVRTQDGTMRIVRRAGDARVVVSRVSGHVYALPSAELHYLGSVLDLSLFDLTALARLKGGRIPVRLAFAGAARPVAGVLTTARSRASGYLTAASAQSFGAALRRHAVPGLRSMRLATSGPGSYSRRPSFPQVTVTVRVTAPTDPAPDAVVATVVNTDDANRYGRTVEIRNGETRLSVPKGNYSIICFSETNTGRTAQTLRMAFAVDQHVVSPGHVIHIDLTAATASGFPNYHTDKTLKVRGQQEFYSIQDQRGRTSGGDWEIFGGKGVTLLVAGRPGGTHGYLVSINNEVLSGPGGGMNRPVYWFTSSHRNGVVAGEQVAVAPTDLARVDAGYYSDGATNSAAAGRTPVYPYFDPGVLTYDDTPPMPGRRTEYVLNPPGVVWLTDVEAQATDGGFTDVTGFDRFVGGGTYQEDFWRGPLAPGVTSQPAGARTYPYDGPPTCWVCGTATGMSVGLAPFVDTTPTHGGVLFAGPGQTPRETRLTVYRDGGVVFDGTNAADNPFASAQLATPSDNHSYRIVETLNRAVDGLSLSTSATTDYRFASSATSGARLGSGWDCGAGGTGACTVLPLLAVHVPLPTSLTGTLPAGNSFMIVDVDHVQGAAPTSITGLTMAIGTPGAPFVRQQVTSLGGGRYYVAIRNTAPAGTPVTMRWHATDAAGSSITQTVAKAYTVATG